MYNFLEKYRWPKLVPITETNFRMRKPKKINFPRRNIITELPHKKSLVPEKYNLREKNFKADLKDPKVDQNNETTPLAFGWNSTLKRFQFSPSS